MIYYIVFRNDEYYSFESHSNDANIIKAHLERDDYRVFIQEFSI